ncbi:MAG: hypothetical protein AAGF48_14720 [Pseudomonadota bacterium]
MNPYSEEAVGALRNILSSFNTYEIRSWNRTSDILEVAGEHTLRRFANGETWPERQTIEKVYRYFRVRSVRRSLWDQPWAIQCRTDLEKLYDLSTLRDPYRILKQRARLSNDEQKRIAAELKGDYFILRPYDRYGSVLSHLRIFDSFPHYGLATCRISRAMRDLKSGAFERDLLIEGGVFRKTSTLNILGYDVIDGDVRMIALRDIGQGGYHGFMTGFDTRNAAFSARTVMQKLEDDVEYEDIRQRTGLWSDQSLLLEFLVELFGGEHFFVDRCRNLGTGDYLTSHLD